MSVGMVVLVFVVWCVLSVPVGIFLGRMIAGPGTTSAGPCGPTRAQREALKGWKGGPR